MSEESKNNLSVLDPTIAFKNIQKSLDPNSMMSQAIDNIAKFQENINRIKNLNKPLGKINSESSLEETNKRLENIEQGFEDLQNIASESAKIANMLNASAAEFLIKFEKASMDNQRSARIAIILATLAVISTLLSPFLPSIIEYLK